MYHGWLIYSKNDIQQNQSFIDWFINEASQQNLSLVLIVREELTVGIMNNKRTIRLKGNLVNQPDFAIVRTIEPLLSLHMEACGITVFNSSTIAHICNDKALTHHHITNLGIPMVDTIFFKKDSMPNTVPIPYPCVVKETSGRGGKQVYYIRNQQEWLNCLDIISTNEVIIQSCNVKLGKDIRVFIVGKEIIGAVLRESNKDFRANFKLGGSAHLYELNKYERSIIEKIIKQFNFGMVGIDFLIGLDGKLLFNEIEDVVGSRTLSAVSDINILQKYVTHINQKIN